MSALYVHVPFCQSRCVYCDFYSTTHTAQWQARYVDALEREMALRKQELGDDPVRTLYLGGGTPSQLSPQLLLRLFDALQRHFSFENLTETTIEANPDDVSPQWLDALQQTPVNRISMGVQSLHDEQLRFLRRRHTAEQARTAVRLCRERGYSNLSLDLIYGLPSQTFEQWQADVDALLQLEVPHLSAYALSYEEGTALWQMLEQGNVLEVGEEEQLRMYEYLMDATAAAGLRHYEISNFAIPGKESQHNSSYWNDTRYLGLGPAAHSYDGERTRRANNPDLRAYVEAAGDAPHSVEHLTEEEHYDEYIMTRLRTAEGLDLSTLTDAQCAHCLRQAEQYLRSGQLLMESGRLRLHRSGIFISNSIISQLMW